MSNVKRVYVEKKEEFASAAHELLHDLKSYLGIKGIESVRVLIRYDVENISEEIYKKACRTVFAEPPVDLLYEEIIPGIEGARDPVIKTATTYVITGNVSDDEFAQIKAYCINPVDSKETSMEKPETLVSVFPQAPDVSIFEGFTTMPEEEFKALYDSLGLAMTYRDFQFIREHFLTEEKRDPSVTEIKVLDTYWSDHCRHTTFSTELKNVEFEDGDYTALLKGTYEDYMKTREELFAGRTDKFVCLMDLALVAMKKLKAEGKLEDMEKSDEINACSIVVPIDVDHQDGKGPVTEEWLINFKNETHNHPTEIEPFGGAATCLGGAIRDPL